MHPTHARQAKHPQAPTTKQPTPHAHTHTPPTAEKAKRTPGCLGRRRRPRRCRRCHAAAAAGAGGGGKKGGGGSLLPPRVVALAGGSAPPFCCGFGGGWKGVEYGWMDGIKQKYTRQHTHGKYIWIDISYTHEYKIYACILP